MNKKDKIIYYVATGLITAMMVMSVGMYFMQHEEVSKTFESLGHPAHVIYPLAVAKILGLLAIWTSKSKSLKEWAYAGFFFDFVLAILAHLNAGDGEFMPAVGAIILLMISYIWSKKMK